jgi:glycosyltransferase involved in cell wall biosynthesis
MLNLAIASPSDSGCPETFIQSHINGIKENVIYFYGYPIPKYVKGEGLFSIDYDHLYDKKAWIHLLSHINLLKYRKSGLSLKEYIFAESLKNHKIDVLLAEYGTASADAVNSCRYAGIPLIAHFHGLDCSRHDVLKAYKDRYQRLFEYASAVVAVSHTMEKQLRSLGCPQNKLVYAPCTPDKDFFNLQPSLENLQFIFVGRFVDKKAPYIILYAFKKVTERFASAKLIMGGDGPLLETCINLAKLWKIDNNVYFPGRITSIQYRHYLSESRAYVQHSIVARNGDSEGTPVSVMEASAAGLPVISTYHAGIPDVIINGETGLLCNEKDGDMMAENMIRIASDISLAKKLGRTGKQYMRNHYSKDWQMKVLTDTVEEAVKSYKQLK